MNKNKTVYVSLHTSDPRQTPTPEREMRRVITWVSGSAIVPEPNQDGIEYRSYWDRSVGGRQLTPEEVAARLGISVDEL